MAHFAEINSNNEVLRVIVVNNTELLDSFGKEQEQIGIGFCKTLFGGIWIQTSYNSKFRKNYAGVGFTYNNTLDAFIPPKPFSSWTLNEDTCQWIPPISYPDDGNIYFWDEASQNWKQT